MEYKDVRDTLRAAINRKNCKQTAIAGKANISPCKLSMILQKKQKLDVDTLIAICRAMEIQPGELLKPLTPDPTRDSA